MLKQTAEPGDLWWENTRSALFCFICTLKIPFLRPNPHKAKRKQNFCFFKTLCWAVNDENLLFFSRMLRREFSHHVWTLFNKKNVTWKSLMLENIHELLIFCFSVTQNLQDCKVLKYKQPSILSLAFSKSKSYNRFQKTLLIRVRT